MKENITNELVDIILHRILHGREERHIEYSISRNVKTAIIKESLDKTCKVHYIASFPLAR